MIRTSGRVASMLAAGACMKGGIRFRYSAKDERFVSAYFTVVKVHWFWCQVLVLNSLDIPASPALHPLRQGSDIRHQPSRRPTLVGHHFNNLSPSQSHHFPPHLRADEENFQDRPCLAHIRPHQGRLEGLGPFLGQQNKDELATLSKTCNPRELQAEIGFCIQPSLLPNIDLHDFLPQKFTLDWRRGSVRLSSSCSKSFVTRRA